MLPMLVFWIGFRFWYWFRLCCGPCWLPQKLGRGRLRGRDELDEGDRVEDRDAAALGVVLHARPDDLRARERGRERERDVLTRYVDAARCGHGQERYVFRTVHLWGLVWSAQTRTYENCRFSLGFCRFFTCRLFLERIGPLERKSNENTQNGIQNK